MRLIYINEKYEFVGPGNRVRQIKAITESNDPIKAYGIQTLYRMGCLSEIDENKPLWPTELLKIIVELIYDEVDLTEISIGKKAKTADSEILKVFIACNSLESYSDVLGNLSHHLASSNIKHVVADVVKRSFPLVVTPIIAVCVGLKGSPIEKLKELIDISKKRVVKILLPDFKEDGSINIFIDTFDFSKKDAIEIKRFVEFCEKNRSNCS